MMITTNLHQILDVLRRADSFVITTHANPDGDAVGSVLAMYWLLKAMGKERVACLNDDPVPRLYQWLPGADRFECTGAFSSPVEAEVVILMDAARLERTGKTRSRLPEKATYIVLDHHLEASPDGDWVYIDKTASAVGEIVWALFDAANLPVTYEAAQCAYVAIATDTGGFRFRNTTPQTHRIAASLVETGIDVSVIALHIFDTCSLQKIHLLQRALERLTVMADGRLAHTWVTLADMTETGARIEDLDGIVNYTRNIEGVEVGFLFREIPGATKVSARSNTVFDCVRFFGPYGGGGHKLAAGATLSISLDEAKREILTQACQALGESA